MFSIAIGHYEQCFLVSRPRLQPMSGYCFLCATESDVGLSVCVFVCQNDPIYFKHRPQYSSSGAGMLAVPCTAGRVVFSVVSSVHHSVILSSREHA